MPNSDYLMTQRKMKKIKTEITYIHNDVTTIDYPTGGPNVGQTPNALNNQVYQYPNQNGFANPNDPAAQNNYYNSSFYGWSTTTTSLNYNNGSQTMQTYNHTTTTYSATSTEDTFEFEVRETIKVIHKAYQDYLNPIIQFLTEEIHLNPNHYSHRQSQIAYQNNYLTNNNVDIKNVNEVIDYFRFYARKFASFSEKIPGLNELTLNDKEELVKCSIHSVTLLSLQKHAQTTNYFNYEQAKIEKYYKEFPIVFKANSFMKTIHEKFKKFELDDKEYALYSALLVISTGMVFILSFFLFCLF